MSKALILLLLPSLSWGVAMTACPGGGYVPSANYPTWCPNDITTINTAPTDTTADISVTSSAATGTTYVSIRLTDTRVHWRTIVNGTGDEASASAAQASTTTSIAVTGLSDTTTYYAHVVNVLNNKPSSYEIAEFVTSAGGSTGDAISGGDDWYFCPDGSDASSGLSHAARKANYPQLDTDLLGASDDMWLCTGGIWTARTIDIARAGASGDWSETGTYYMDGATSRKIVDGVRGAGTTQAKAVLRGGLTAACANAGTCTFPNTGFPLDGGLVSQYDAHVNIKDTADYNEVKNLRVEYARYRGINVQGAGVLNSLRYLKIDGVDVGYTGYQSIVVERGVSDMVVRNGDYTWAGMCKSFRSAGTSADTTGCSSGGAWPQAISMTDRSQRILIENNDVRNIFGEGVGSYGHVNTSYQYLIVRGNRIVNTHSGALYFEAAGTVLENNIALGGGTNATVRNTVSPLGPAFSGAAFNNERSNTRPTVNNLSRNNLLVGVGEGLVLNNSTEALIAGINYGAKFYGNTVIAPYTRTAKLNMLAINGSLTQAQTTMIEWDIRNNLLWDETNNASQCSAGTDANVTTGYNHWSTNPSDSDCDGAGDSYDNTPGISTSSYATWVSYGNQSGELPVSWPAFSNAAPTVGGDVINSGTTLSTAILDKDNYGFAYDQIAEVLTGSLTEAEWECALCVDAEGTTRSGAPSKGAVE